MEWKKSAPVLAGTFLFQNCKIEDYQKYLQQAPIVSYAKGEVIYDRLTFTKQMGILLSGKVVVEGGKEDKIILNVLQKGQAFGVAGLFGQREEYVSRIVAKEKTTVIFIGEELLKELFLADFTINLNYIRFLSDRICFLNDRLQSLTGQTAEQKLAGYLLQSASKISDQEKMILPFSIKDLALTLDVGRASVYRAFDTLEQEGVIRRTNKEVTIEDRNRLKIYLDGKITEISEGDSI